MPTGPCPLCGCPAGVEDTDYEEWIVVNCPNCRNYKISQTALNKLDAGRSKTVISHAAFKMGGAENAPIFDRDLVKKLLEEDHLPSHTDQADIFIAYIGKQLQYDASPGGEIIVDPAISTAMLGVSKPGDVWFIADELAEAGFLRVGRRTIREGVTRDCLGVKMTFTGWDRYRDIEERGIVSRTAFMAMQYKDPVVDDMYETCFKPAVEATGFVLRRLDENRKTGVIDNHLRVEIRNSRFLLADLTHDNRGAYWEAGLAEGLGRPVIYLCERSVFENEKLRPHFDTNHCQTVVWEQNKKQAAEQGIKDMIRATLPGEAKMGDEEA